MGIDETDMKRTNALKTADQHFKSYEGKPEYQIDKLEDAILFMIFTDLPDHEAIADTRLCLTCSDANICGRWYRELQSLGIFVMRGHQNLQKMNAEQSRKQHADLVQHRKDKV